MHVYKIGGAEGVPCEAIADDLAAQWFSGRRFCVVHGGSGETDRLAESLGHPPQFVTSVSGHQSRRTDRRTLEIFIMATAAVNRRWVSELQRRGCPALGLSGLDGGLIRARRKAAIRVVENGRQRVIRDDWTGTPHEVNELLIRTLLDTGYLPVIAPVAMSEEGDPLNVDGDRLAARIASTLGAETLVFLTNVPGLLERFPDERSLIPRIEAGEIDAALETAQGRMRKKILGAREALEGGVSRAIIADGRRDAPIAGALAGGGTTIVGTTAARAEQVLS